MGQAEKSEFVAKQFKEAMYHEGQKVQQVTCCCNICMPLRFAYKCLYCGEYYCLVCAEAHFGKTRAEHIAEKEWIINQIKEQRYY